MTIARDCTSTRAEESRTPERLAIQPGPARAVTLMAAALGASRGTGREEDG